MNIYLRTVAGAVFLAASAEVSSQTCASPITGTQGSGDTCAASNELGTLCIFAQSPSNDVVYSITLGPDFTVKEINLFNHTPTWDAALVMLEGACNGNSICPRNADANGPGEGETINGVDLPAGQYFLIVTSAPSSTTCGSYSLTIVATPVELQSFDVS